MKKGIKLAAFLALWIFSLNQPMVQAQTDTLQTKKFEPITQTAPEPELRLTRETKRQHNKTEKMVFVSCLLIVLTTFLLYNVRSK